MRQAGLVDVEPLYVPNLTIGGATHSVVFIVTEHDLAYAFDADTQRTLYKVALADDGSVDQAATTG